ncbi:hypothetical protein ACIPI6_14985 [Pseudomonas protegens]|uniref:hypothetical protein n=1 Tax=Pseudomonas protegens TaxID=380021 RepID=UPI0037FD8AE4
MTDRSKADWFRVFQESHAESDEEHGETSRLEYLAGAVFDINTYDGEIDHLMAAKAVEVCRAISDKTTFEYIKDPENYRWYLIMCHLPFFADRIEWGTSIRGAFWDSYAGVSFQSCMLFDHGAQLHEPMKLSDEGWKEFIAAVIEYGEAP